MSSDEQYRNELRKALLFGAQTGSFLQQRLALSQSSFSRLIQNNKSDIITLGAARSTQYALKLPVSPELRGEIPIFRIDQNGNASPYASLCPLANNEYGMKMHGENTFSLLDHIPHLIQNMRPEGFMGRAFCQRYAQELKLPSDLNSWSDNHALIALAKRGEDMTGNLIVGKESIDRYFELAGQDIVAIKSDQKAAAYPRLAEQALEGGVIGSSAGGEQPKFTALLQTPSGPSRVIVKFAKAETDEGKRWCDLLVCENIAADLLNRNNIQAAKTNIVQHNNWTFLESERFDRTGVWGRLPLVSMKTLEAEFIGGLEDRWSDCANGLLSQSRLTEETCFLIHDIEGFGRLIGNADMHLGNLSLIPKGTQYDLAPVYDMTPMIYRPKPGGFLPMGKIAVTSSPAPNIRSLATEFWATAAEDQRLSKGFQATCMDNLKALTAMEDRPSMRMIPT